MVMILETMLTKGRRSNRFETFLSALEEKKLLMHSPFSAVEKGSNAISWYPFLVRQVFKMVPELADTTS